MTSNKLSEYVAFRGTTKRLLVTIGLWPGIPLSRKCQIFVAVEILFCLTTTMAMIGYIRVSFTNVGALTKCLGIMVSFITVILKVSKIFI